MYKSGFVSVIGRPNVGKSTLLNQIIGEKFQLFQINPPKLLEIRYNLFLQAMIFKLYF